MKLVRDMMHKKATMSWFISDECRPILCFVHSIFQHSFHPTSCIFVNRVILHTQNSNLKRILLFLQLLDLILFLFIGNGTIEIKIYKSKHSALSLRRCKIKIQLVFLLCMVHDTPHGPSEFYLFGRKVKEIRVKLKLISNNQTDRYTNKSSIQNSTTKQCHAFDWTKPLLKKEQQPITNFSSLSLCSLSLSLRRSVLLLQLPPIYFHITRTRIFVFPLFLFYILKPYKPQQQSLRHLQLQGTIHVSF